MPRFAASRMKRSAVSSNSTSVARSSVERRTRETSEMTTIMTKKTDRHLQPARILDDRVEKRVDEDQHDGAEPDDRSPLLLAPCREKDRHRGRGNHRQDAGRVGTGLGVDIGSKEDRHHETDEREDDDQRSRGPRPVGGHAVARQVARHDVEQARPSPRRRRTRGSGSSRRRRRCRRRRRGTRGRGRPARGHSPRRPLRTPRAG